MSKTIPRKEDKILVQSRVSKKAVAKLKKANANIPEIIRIAITDAAAHL